MKNLLIKHCPSSSLVQLGKINFKFFKYKERSKRKADDLNRGQGRILNLGFISLVDLKQPVSKWNKLKRLKFSSVRVGISHLNRNVAQYFQSTPFFSLEISDRSIVLPY